MKELVLSISLIFVFSAYTLYVRIMGASAPVALTPEPNKQKVALSLPQYKTTTGNPKTGPTPKPTTTSSSGTSSTPTPIPTSNPTPAPAPAPVVANVGKYKNGTYTGSVIDAYYGNIQVRTVISGGEIVDVQFLDYPQDRKNSVRINERAMPYLISEAITIQDSNVDTVSGASFTSAAYRKSLSSALAQARQS